MRYHIIMIGLYILCSSIGYGKSNVADDQASTALLNHYISKESNAYLRIPNPKTDQLDKKEQKSTLKRGWKSFKNIMGDVADKGSEWGGRLMESDAGSYLQYLNPNQYVDLSEVKAIAQSPQFKEFLKMEGVKKRLGVENLQEQIEQFDLNELLGLRIMGLSVGEFLALRAKTNAPFEMITFSDYYLITTQFNLHHYQELNQLLVDVLNLDRRFLLNQEGIGSGMDREGERRYFYTFDQSSGRFLLVIAEDGLAAPHLYRFREAIATAEASETFQLLEQYADQSKRDWMLWVSTLSNGEDETMGDLNRFLIRLLGLNLEQIKNHNIRSLTLGHMRNHLGSHLTLLIESPMNRYLNYPTINPNAYDFTVPDRPIQIRAFSLPTADMIKEGEDGLMGKRVGKYFNQLLEAILKGYEIDITELFTIFGKEGATYRNRNGAFLALKLKDHEGYLALLEMLDINALKRQILEEDVHQYILENRLKDLIDQYLGEYQAYAEQNGGSLHHFLANRGIPWLLKRSGLYREIQLNFQQQNDWVFISFQPTPLIERSRSTIMLNQWLYYQTHFSEESLYGMIYNLNEADLQKNRYYHRFIDLVGNKFNWSLSALRLRENAQIEVAAYLQPQFFGATATYNLSSNDLIYLVVNYNIAYLFWIPRIIVNLYDYYHMALKEMEKSTDPGIKGEDGDEGKEERGDDRQREELIDEAMEKEK